jgi:hypothetical protein
LPTQFSKTGFLFFFMVLLLYGVAEGEDETITPKNPSAYGNISIAFQSDSPYIQPDGSKKEIHSYYQYLELNAIIPEERLSFNSYLRGRQIFNEDENSFDAYYAFLQYGNESGSLRVRLGRQILTEGINYHLVDGGLVKFRTANEMELVAYGGYQDRDSHPEPEEPLESSSIIGIKLKFNELLDSIVSVGYERIDPDGFSSRDFLHASLNRVLPFFESADLYSRGEFDVGEKNLALLTAGIGWAPFRQVHLNVEHNIYEPDGDRGDYLQDRIFDIFSVSRLHQSKGGLTFIANRNLKTSVSYAYTRYEILEDEWSHGHEARLGLTWDFWRQIGLKAFQGLYYLDGRGKDRAVGVNFSVSEELLRGLNLHYSFASVRFVTITGQDGNAYSHALGIQYLFMRNVLLKAEVEINDNPDFDKDMRGNIIVSYDFYF